MSNEQGIFTQEELAAASAAGQIESNLPPPGHARDEELKRRTDDLAEKAETTGAEGGTIPPQAFEPIHEIQRDIQKSYLDIGSNNPYFKTKWVNYVNNNQQAVWIAKNDGWAVAGVDKFPDGKHAQREDGTIRVGDVILMYMPTDKYLVIQKREKEKRLRQQYGVTGEIHEIAGKYPDAFTVKDGAAGTLDDQTAARMQSRAANPAARQVAAQHIGNRMKEGTIPGVPLKNT